MSATRAAEVERHEAIQRAEQAQAELVAAHREAAARIGELQAALDRVQSAAIQAQAEAEHYRDLYGAARQDIDGLAQENRDLRDQLAAERGEGDRCDCGVPGCPYPGGRGAQS